MKQRVITCHNDLRNSLESIESVDHARTICLIKGRSSFEKSGAEIILNDVFRQKEIIVFDEFEPNPKLGDVKHGLQLLDGRVPDLFVAVGGGSIIDMAKLVRLFAFQRNIPEKLILGEAQYEQVQLPPLLVIPTTAGSGSESTHFAVVYIDGLKHSVADKQMILPDIVCLDGALSLGMPKKVSAYTGIDAFAQAIESYWAISSTEESRKDSARAMKETYDNLFASLHGERRAREVMLEAANHAGRAINITKTTGAHAYSYYLTSHLGLPHGHAAGLMLKVFLYFNSAVNSDDCNDERGVEFVTRRILEIQEILGCTSVDEICTFIDDIFTEAGLTKNVSIDQFPDSSLDGFLGSVNLERLKNNPRAVTDENVQSLLYFLDELLFH